MKNLQISRSTLYHIYISLFFLSGFSGLIYESIWTHYLKLLLGHAAYSQALVLVIFMGGMALGAWVTARYSTNIVNLFLGYAIVEGIIGLYGIFFHAIFTRVSDLIYFSITPGLNSLYLVSACKWVAASSIIFPSAVLLGSTFPLMSAGLIRNSPEDSGRSLAVLYFSNSLGASIGVLMSGFVFINYLGFEGTTQIAGLLNIFIALIVWLTGREKDYSANNLSSMSHQKEKMPSQILVLMLLACAVFTGVASFIYEIVWIRMLSLVLGSSTHAFELMLSAFILGLAIGAFWIKSKIGQLKNPLITLGIIQILMGLLALSTLMVYSQTFYLMEYMFNALRPTNQGYLLYTLFSHGICLLVMLPATICAGMTLPIISYYLISNNAGEGAIGKVYALNTVGAIGGVLLAYQLISFWGVKNLIIFGSGIDIIVGLALLWKMMAITNRKYWSFIATGTMAVIAFNFLFIQLDPNKMTSGVFRWGHLGGKREVVFHKDGKTASIDLTFANDKYAILTNGKPEASISTTSVPSMDEFTQVFSAALPASLHSAPKSVAVIGMGSGMTTNVILKDPGIERCDIIEIEPAMVEAASLLNNLTNTEIEDSRINIVVEDARTFFSYKKNKYDLIISEPSNPWVSGVSNLFTKEFYHLIKKSVNEDGLFIQWMHLYEMNIYLLLTVIDAVSLNFNDYAVYTVQGDILIVANTNGKLPEPSERIFTIPELDSTLTRCGFNSIQDLRLAKLGTREIFDSLLDAYDVIPNSDYFPILDLNASKALYLRQNANELMFLRTINLPIIPVLEGAFNTSEDLSNTDKLSIVRNDRSPIRRNAFTAKEIYDYFAASKNGSILPKINASNLKMIESVSSANYRCDGNSLNTIWFEALQTLAVRTLPYLSSNEMEIILNNIQSMKCFDKLSDETLQWFNLYTAVSRNDFNNILKFSSELLSKEIDSSVTVPLSSHFYLLTAAMLASIALDDNEGALSIFEKYKPSNFQSIVLTLLSNYAMQKHYLSDSQIQSDSLTTF